MIIDQKWKTYALSLIFSDWDNTPAPVLFDYLTDTDSDSIDDLFLEHDITVWQPFENISYRDLIDHMICIATQAEHTAKTV